MMHNIPCIWSRHVRDQVKRQRRQWRSNPDQKRALLNRSSTVLRWPDVAIRVLRKKFGLNTVNSRTDTVGEARTRQRKESDQEENPQVMSSHIDFPATYLP